MLLLGFVALRTFVVTEVLVLSLVGVTNVLATIHQLLLNVFLHLIEAAYLLGIEHGGKLVEVLDADTLSTLLTLELLSRPCQTLLVSSGLSVLLAIAPDGLHLLAVATIDGFKLHLLLVSHVEAIHQLAHLSGEKLLVEGSALVCLRCSHQRREAKQHGHHHLLHFQFTINN